MAPSRRTVLAGLAAAATVSALPRRPALAQPAPAGPLYPAIRERTLGLLAALAPAKAARARFALGSEVWTGWNYMGNTLVKPGIRFEEMESSEAGAGEDLLAALLSPAGAEKVRRVRVLQDVLAELRIGPADRNSRRYSFAVFGEPAADTVWGLRFEGHHLELTLTLRGDEIVSVTPSSFSCNPNDVTVGPTAGTTAITAEEELARRLFADLPAGQQAVARIANRARNNIVATAGFENFFTNRQGLPAADMATAQQDLVWQIVDTYAAEHWRAPIAEAQRGRVREGDRGAVFLAWAGGNEDGTPLYYRLHGDTFVIELAAVDSAAQHLHTIYHDTDRTLGRHVLG